jgi:hypothetical protein
MSKNHHHSASKKNRFHKDWRVWAVVLLMLGAMVIYVLSFDERFQFGGKPKPAKPAASGSANGDSAK